MGARIVAVCNEFDKLLHQNGKSVQQSFQILEGNEEKFDLDLVEILKQVIEDQPELIESGPGSNADAHDALAVGKHVEELYSALESMDRQQLETSVQSLQRDAAPIEGSEICSALEELTALLQSEESSPEIVHEVAQQVIDLCRTTRDSFVISDDIRQLSDVLR